MTVDTNTTRRAVLLTAGAVGLGALTPATAEASRFTRLDAAITELRQTKKFLQNAKDIFGGHKAAAIRLVNETIKELEAAIKFAS